ncbi:MAG: ParB/RepB/Spo0J family partition protein [Planctomycetota bacterium]|nr:ParB/RepB/Spo0J family partition protein [Planctomycetota bacterium]
MTKARLGKGLGALLGEYVDDAPRGEAQLIDVKSIGPNPQQPRKAFSDDELAELAQSIEENGLLQPILLRPAPKAPGKYELVAGERRLRAVRMLGWKAVPAVTREVDDDTLLVLALVENLQREALNPMEEAEGYQILMDRYGLSHAGIGRSVGKSRSTVANMVRLLQLPASVRTFVEVGSLTTGHARALLALDDQGEMVELALKAIAESWSVREMESHAGVNSVRKTKKSKNRAFRPRDPVTQALEEDLRAALATKANVRLRRGGSGVIEVPFRDHEDFERVFHLITGREVSEVVS